MSTPSNSSSNPSTTMPKSLTPSQPTPVPSRPIEVDVDATTLMAITAALLLLPLLLSGFFYQ